MVRLMADAPFTADEVTQFITWAVVENKFSRDYLAVARDPMESLAKNLGTLLPRWKLTRPASAVDGLWERVVVHDGGKELEQTRLRRKPETKGERREVLAMMATPGKSRSYFVPWLAQDKCQKCKGTGGVTERVPLDRHGTTVGRWRECGCVTVEEVLK